MATSKPVKDMSTLELEEAYNAETQCASQVPDSSDPPAEAESTSKEAKEESKEEIDPVEKAKEEANLKAQKEKEEMAQFWARIRAERKERTEAARRKREREHARMAKIEAEEAEMKKRRRKYKFCFLPYVKVSHPCCFISVARAAEELKRMKERDPGVPTKECYEEWERRKEYRRLHPTDHDKMERLKRGPSYQPRVPMPMEAKYWIKKEVALPPSPEPEPKGEKKECCTKCCTCQCDCGLFPDVDDDGTKDKPSN